MSNVSPLSVQLRSASVGEFILRAHKLERSAFWQWQNQRPVHVDHAAIVAGNWLAYDGLREEDLDSFCLNLRLLIQDRDGISIRKMSQHVALWPDAHAEQKSAVQVAVATLNERLDRPCLVSLSTTGKTTIHELFSVLFYGGLVHSDELMREEYRRVIKAGLFSYFVFTAFWGVLCDFRNCIQSVAHHMARAIIAAGEHEQGG